MGEERKTDNPHKRKYITPEKYKEMMKNPKMIAPIRHWGPYEWWQLIGPVCLRISPLERIVSVGDVQKFAWHTGLNLFVTPLAHFCERISGAAHGHLVLGIDSALYSDSGVPQV